MLIIHHSEHEELPRAYVAIKSEHKGASSEWDVEKWVAGRVAKHKQLSGGVVFIEEVLVEMRMEGDIDTILTLPLDQSHRAGRYKGKF